MLLYINFTLEFAFNINYSEISELLDKIIMDDKTRLDKLKIPYMILTQTYRALLDGGVNYVSYTVSNIYFLILFMRKNVAN